MVYNRRPYALYAPLLVTVLLLQLLSVSAVFAQEGEGAPADDLLLPGQSALRINEFMASNQRAYGDPTTPGSYPDWVELYNPGDQPVSLDGLALTDREKEPARAPILPGRFIAPRGFYVFYLDGALERGPEHVDLGLSADGEYIGLYHVASGERIDGYTFGPQTPDLSEGRLPDGSGEFQLLSAPTPHSANQPPPAASDEATLSVGTPVTATVTAFRLNVRTAPDRQSARITRVNQGELLRADARDEECQWIRIATPAGEEGWVAAQWVALDAACTDLPLDASDADASGAPPTP